MNFFVVFVFHSSFFSDMTPTLGESQLLKCDNVSVRIIETVAHKWQDLAMALGFNGPQIKSIEANYHGRCQDASREIFIKWLDGALDVSGPGTWNMLASCLERIGMKDLATKVKCCLSGYLSNSK